MDLLFKYRKGCKLFYDVFVGAKRMKQSGNKWKIDVDIEDDLQYDSW